jgi:hypothetical protein
MTWLARGLPVAEERSRRAAIPRLAGAIYDAVYLDPDQQEELASIEDEEERQEFLAEIARAGLNPFDFSFDFEAAGQ